MKMSKTENIQCSFCGRSREEVKILIAGQDGHICEHCIEHAHEIVDKEFHLTEFKEAFSYLKSGKHFGKICIKF